MRRFDREERHVGGARPTKRACFFARQGREQLRCEQYSLQDIRALEDLGFDVTIAARFAEIPWRTDLYFSWWAAGSILPLIKARLSRTPIVVVAGGNDSTRFQDSKTGKPYGYLAAPWYKKLAARLSLRYASAIVAVSDHMREQVQAFGATTCVVIPNSVDTERFCPAEEDRTLVTSVFNLDRDVVALKRGDVFLRAIPRILESHPTQRFAVIGRRGDAQAALERLVRELGVEAHVEFLGSIDNDEVPRWMQRSRAYVQLSDTETFGMSIAEAMSCATPVVVGRVGAVPELVGDCGIYVDHNDAAAVASAVSAVLSLSEAEHSAMGARARARILDRFTYEHRLAAVAQLLQEMQARG